MINKLILGVSLVLLPLSYSYADNYRLTYKYAKCASATHYYWRTYLNRERSTEPSNDWLTIHREFHTLRSVSMMKVKSPYGLVAEGEGNESFLSSVKALENFAPVKVRNYVETEVAICMKEHSKVLSERFNRH